MIQRKTLAYRYQLREYFPSGGADTRGAVGTSRPPPIPAQKGEGDCCIFVTVMGVTQAVRLGFLSSIMQGEYALPFN